jgi:predicted Zn-dependent protease
MIKQLIFGALFLGSASSYSVTFQQAQNVFNKLNNISGQHASLYYDPTLSINAWAIRDNITITQGMLNTLKNEHQLAMVLGHEIGHKALSHHRPKFHPRQEMNADDVGYYYCKKAGYTRCIDALKVLQRKMGNKGGGEHPPWNVRIKNVKNHR